RVQSSSMMCTRRGGAVGPNGPESRGASVRWEARRMSLGTRTLDSMAGAGSSGQIPLWLKGGNAMSTPQQSEAATRMFSRVLGPYLAIIAVVALVRASELSALLTEFSANTVWPWIT